MVQSIRLLVTFLFVPVLLAGSPPPAAAQQPPMPPARKIPGITVADPVPGACVDCHIVHVQENLDVRLSTILKAFSQAVPPEFLARVQPTAPEGITLAGKHPAMDAEVFRAIPESCLECHRKDARKAPPFARMLHAIHLQGGEANHFLTIYQGECTLCHKLDPKTAGWSIPSGPER